MQLSNHRDYRIFVQARMSSQRFPGKMLAPVFGVPLVEFILKTLERDFPLSSVVVVTSEEKSDDVLARHVESLGVDVFRGPLDDVYGRFCDASRRFPSDWVFRVCGDSPFPPTNLMRSMLSRVDSQVDLVTNVFPRTFPKGQSVELIRVATLFEAEEFIRESEEREHVTTHFYRNAPGYKVVNLKNQGEWKTPGADCAIDTIDDLRRIESSEAFVERVAL